MRKPASLKWHKFSIKLLQERGGKTTDLKLSEVKTILKRYQGRLYYHIESRHLTYRNVQKSHFTPGRFIASTKFNKIIIINLEKSMASFFL